MACRRIVSASRYRITSLSSTGACLPILAAICVKAVAALGKSIRGHALVHRGEAAHFGTAFHATALLGRCDSWVKWPCHRHDANQHRA